jgi:Tfp pilus assembly protein PilF
MKRALVLLLLAGCAAPSPAPVEEPAKPQAQRPQETVAVAGLMESARADAAAGRLANAAASLERALRLEPRNPRLWHELARVRLRQGDFAQAESLAARSSTWAASDTALRAENWRVIAQAREGMGDGRGAQAARDNAERMAR